MTTQPGNTGELGPRCWCCGQAYPDSDLVHLGDRPEVAVCLGCARYLHQRARRAQDGNSKAPGALLRTAVGRSREFVVERGLHRLPILGAPLRWLGDHLP